MTLGNKIKQKREEKNLSQEKLAELLGLSRQTIYNFENDLTLPNSKDLKNIARELECTYNYLLNDEEIECKPKETGLYTDIKKNWPKIYIVFLILSIVFGTIGIVELITIFSISSSYGMGVLALLFIIPAVTFIVSITLFIISMFIFYKRLKLKK